jgi:N-acetylneuraminic acid mutarotase
VKRITILTILISLSLQAITIPTGWSLLGSSAKIDLAEKFPDDGIDKLIWTYSSNGWLAYGNTDRIKNAITSNNIPLADEVGKYSGFWIQNFGQSFDVPLENGSITNLEIKSGWNLLGNGEALNISFFQNLPQLDLFWNYKNGSWFPYGNSEEQKREVSQSLFTPLTTLPENSGYWVRNIGGDLLIGNSDENGTIYGQLELPSGFGGLEDINITIYDSSQNRIFSTKLEDNNFSFENVPVCGECKAVLSGSNYLGTNIIQKETPVSISYGVSTQLPFPPTFLNLNKTAGDNLVPDVLHIHLEENEGVVSLQLRVADPEGDEVTCEVDWGDGNISILSECYREELTHEYNSGGFKFPVIRVSDSYHSKAIGKRIEVSTSNNLARTLPRTLNREVSVANNHTPKIQLVSDELDYNFFKVSFFAFDFDGDDLECNLSIVGEDDSIELNATYFGNCQEETYEINFRTIGEKSVSMFVSDGKSIDSYSYEVNVTSMFDSQPTFRSVNIDPHSNRVAKVTGALSREVEEISIDWGDGNKESFTTFTSFDLNFSKRYPNDGTYTVIIEVVDDQNNTSIGTRTIEVLTNYAPDIEIQDFRASNGKDIEITWKISDRDDDEIANSMLLWGDGESIEIQNKGSLKHTYEEQPEEPLQIISVDNKGNTRIEELRNKISVPPKIVNLSSEIFRDKLYIFGELQRTEKDFDVNISWGDKNLSNFEAYTDYTLKDEGWHEINLSLTEQGWKGKDLSLDINRSSLASGVDGNKIYIVGGYTGNGYSSAIEVFDEETLSLSSIDQKMPHARGYLSAVGYKGKIYTAGGAGYKWQEFEVYDIYDNQKSWKEEKRVPTPRIYLSLEAVNDKVYAIGGFGLDWNEVEIYDIYNRVWTGGRDMPTPRGGLSTALVGNKIYVIGGFEKQSNQFSRKVEVYDTIEDTWGTIAELKTPRAYHTSFYYNNKIYVIGGMGIEIENEQEIEKYLDSVEILDLESGQWSYGESLSIPRAFATGSLILDKDGRVGRYYLFGGKKSDYERVGTVELYSPDYSFVENNSTELNYRDGSLFIEAVSHKYGTDGDYPVSVKFIDRDFLVSKQDFVINIDTSPKIDISRLKIDRGFVEDGNNTIRELRLDGSIGFEDTNITSAKIIWGDSSVEITDFDEVNISKIFYQDDVQVTFQFTDHLGRTDELNKTIWVEIEKPRIDETPPELVFSERNVSFPIHIIDRLSGATHYKLSDKNNSIEGDWIAITDFKQAYQCNSLDCNEQNDSVVYDISETIKTTKDVALLRGEGNISIKIEELNNSTRYFLYLKDEAENISELNNSQISYPEPLDKGIIDVIYDVTAPKQKLFSPTGTLNSETGYMWEYIYSSNMYMQDDYKIHKGYFGFEENASKRNYFDINLSDANLSVEYNVTSFYVQDNENCNFNETEFNASSISNRCTFKIENNTSYYIVVRNQKTKEILESYDGNFTEEANRLYYLELIDFAEHKFEKMFFTDKNGVIRDDRSPPEINGTLEFTTARDRNLSKDGNGTLYYYYQEPPAIGPKGYYELDEEYRENRPLRFNNREIKIDLNFKDDYAGVTEYAISKEENMTNKTQVWHVFTERTLDGNRTITHDFQDQNSSDFLEDGHHILYFQLRDLAKRIERNGEITRNETYGFEMNITLDTTPPEGIFTPFVQNMTIKLEAKDNIELGGWYFGESSDVNVTCNNHTPVGTPCFEPISPIEEETFYKDFTFEYGKTYYGILMDGFGHKYTKKFDSTNTKYFIDDTAPMFVSGLDALPTETNLSKFDLDIVSKDNFYGVNAYAVTTSSEMPEKWVNGDGNFSRDLRMSDKNQTFWFWLRDVGGNIHNEARTIIFDNIKPKANFKPNVDSMEVNISAYDNHKLKSYYFGKLANPSDSDFVDFDLNHSNEMNETISNFKFDSNTTYYGFVKDYVGYISNVVEIYEYNLTDTTPAIIRDINHTTHTKDGNISLHIYAIDNFSPLNLYKIHDTRYTTNKEEGWVNWGRDPITHGTYKIHLDGNMSYELNITVRDEANNTSEPYPITIYIDQTVPALSWRSGAEMLDNFKNVAVATDGDQTIYTLTGESEAIMPEIYKYNLATNTWSEVNAEVSIPRKDSFAVEVDNKIYLIGGDDGLYHREDVEIFDIATETISKSTHTLNSWRTPSGVVEANGSIFVVGGINEDGNLTTIETNTSNGWEIYSNVPQNYANYSVVSLNGDIYTIGGETANGIDGNLTKLGASSKTSRFKTPRKEHNSIVLDGKVYILGGVDENGTLLASVERNISTTTWEDLTPIPSARKNFGLATLKDSIFLLGGENNESQTLSNLDILQTKIFALNPSGSTVRLVAEDNSYLYGYYFGKLQVPSDTNFTMFHDSNTSKEGNWTVSRVDLNITKDYEDNALSSGTYYGILRDIAGNERNETLVIP